MYRWTAGTRFLQPWIKAKYNVERYDPKTDLARLVMDAGRIDLALIILHGRSARRNDPGLFGSFRHRLPGLGRLGSALAMNKVVSKEIYKRHGLPTPQGITVCKKIP